MTSRSKLKGAVSIIAFGILMTACGEEKPNTPTQPVANFEDANSTTADTTVSNPDSLASANTDAKLESDVNSLVELANTPNLGSSPNAIAALVAQAQALQAKGGSASSSGFDFSNFSSFFPSNTSANDKVLINDIVNKANMIDKNGASPSLINSIVANGQALQSGSFASLFK